MNNRSREKGTTHRTFTQKHEDQLSLEHVAMHSKLALTAGKVSVINHDANTSTAELLQVTVFCEV